MKIFNIKNNKDKNILSYSKNNNFRGKYRYFAPSHIEWLNSIYMFNKNNTKSIPILDHIISKYITIYFNMYNKNAEKRVRFHRLTDRQRWLSSRKVWIGKPELKHTNDKIVINLYIYDRINNIILMKLTHNINNILQNKLISLSNNNIIKNRQDISTNGQVYKTKFENKIYKHLIDHFKKRSTKLDSKVFNNLQNLPIFSTLLSNSIKVIYNNIRIKFTKRIFKQEMKILYYKKFFALNTLKYKSIFMISLQKFISKIYKKKVIFNIISLRNFFQSSSIFTRIIAHKSKNRNNRSNIIFSKALTINTPLFRRSIINRNIKDKYDQNVIIKYNNKIDNNLNTILKDYYITNHFNLEDNALNKLKNKLVIGMRLELAGRLTRRFTAQRAVKRIKYIGTLKNVDSSYKGVSTQVLRNSIGDSTQYSKSNSQNRIGSFGIKGWINSV